ncbi:MAG TPA: HAD family hydrolase [Bryobacteraceae bacterium]|nr:HAD family hydrolase [Bryobacteraceae bacterium]
MAYKALVLFDIDGTLIRRAGPQHKEAMMEAVFRVTGLKTSFDGIPLYGMLDPDIITGMMRNAGASRAAIRAAMPEIVRRAQSIYVRNSPDSIARRMCPGVKRLLDRLTREQVLIGLVTGNLTRIGWKKMERAGLREYFHFGAFGEMATTRGGLAKLAIRRARQEGWIARRARTSLIGDAPADVLAAKQSGAQAIAVATGVVPADQLLGCEPDLLLNDLRELKLEMVL